MGPASRVTARAQDPRWFRRVLGEYPTGVSLITTRGDHGQVEGLVVGSFSSLSLSPPMVTFFPDKGSSTWPKIRRAGRFCVNVLGAEHENVCRQVASRSGERFAGVATDVTAAGTPRLRDAVAWVEADIESVLDAGDHYIVVGRVLDLDVESGSSPLLFFQGGYGRFMSHSVTAEVDPPGDLAEALHAVELVRSDLERLAAEFDSQVYALARTGDDVVVLATATSSAAPSTTTTLVGNRLPFAAPVGTVLAAWSSEPTRAVWLSHAATPREREVHRDHLDAVRRRGYSVGVHNRALDDVCATLQRVAVDGGAPHRDELLRLIPALQYDPASESESQAAADVEPPQMISVPVMGEDGRALLAINLMGFGRMSSVHDREHRVAAVRQVAQHATATIASTR